MTDDQQFFQIDDPGETLLRERPKYEPRPPVAAPCANASAECPVAVPSYLSEVYDWAYINPRSIRILDHSWIVNFILWGNSDRLQRALFEELRNGMHVLQSCCVYGDLSHHLARHLSPEGRLEIIDAVPAQVENCRRKIGNDPIVTIRLADAANPGGGPYDAAISFFLLHEVPDAYKRLIVDALLASIKPGGKVIFIDFHEPHPLHPLKWVLALVFAMLEPFAKTLWHRPITEFASQSGLYSWRTETFFGGLFQKTVARRSSPATDTPKISNNNQTQRRGA